MKMPKISMKRRDFGLLLCLVVLFVTAQRVVPAGVQPKETTELSLLLSEAQHERDYFMERNTRTALLPELSVRLAQSLRIASSSSRTYTGRQRTHTSWTSACGFSLGQKFGVGEPVENCAYGRGSVHSTSRAADYYIYALRHIII